MSVVVAVRHNKLVYMGSDGAISSDEYIATLVAPKIFRKGKLLLGCAGSLRCAQVIKQYLSPRSPNHREDSEHYLITVIVPAIKQIFRQEDAPAGDFECLLAFRGRIFEITSGTFTVIETEDDYGAIGSGYLVALGSLFSTKQMKDSERRIWRALDATARHSPGVSEPFYITRAR